VDAVKPEPKSVQSYLRHILIDISSLFPIITGESLIDRQIPQPTAKTLLAQVIPAPALSIRDSRAPLSDFPSLSPQLCTSRSRGSASTATRCLRFLYQRFRPIHKIPKFPRPRTVELVIPSSAGSLRAIVQLACNNSLSASPSERC
jgi:hypothetical protein